MKNSLPELDVKEIEVLNTPFSELTLEMRSVAFGIRDKLAEHNWKENKKYTSAKGVRITLQDKDKLLANGVLSPITKEPFHNRRDYKNHLKQHGCVEIGNDFNNAKMRTEVNGDFDCRKELSQATYQVMDKYGH